MLSYPLPVSGFPNLPEPSHNVKSLMIATSEVIGGPADSSSAWMREYLPGAIMMPQADTLIFGGDAAQKEVEALTSQLQFDLMIVRSDGDDITYDVRLQHHSGWLTGYCLWTSSAREAWLVPSRGGDQFIRMSRLGLELGYAAPFTSEESCREGILLAHETLVTPVRGVFA